MAAAVTHTMRDTTLSLHISPPDVPTCASRCVAATSLEALCDPFGNDAQGGFVGHCSAFAAACVQMARK